MPQIQKQMNSVFKCAKSKSNDSLFLKTKIKRENESLFLKIQTKKQMDLFYQTQIAKQMIRCLKKPQIK
jgi:hypothetical protein